MPGFPCCCTDEPSGTVDLIFADADVVRRTRLAVDGNTTVWTLDYGTVVGEACTVAGVGYGPSFNGNGLALVTDIGNEAFEGIYEFDVVGGTDNGLLDGDNMETDASLAQECNGQICYIDDGNIRAVNTGGTNTLDGAGTEGNDIALRTGTSIWRTTRGGLSVFGESGAVTRADFSSVAVDADNVISIVSDDGDTFYVLGISNAFDAVELFSYDPLNEEQLLASHAATASSHDGTFTKLGDFLYWRLEGQDKVWRWDINGETLSGILTRTSSDWGDAASADFGNSFFIQDDT
jgi:hypothetical protein